MLWKKHQYLGYKYHHDNAITDSSLDFDWEDVFFELTFIGQCDWLFQRDFNMDEGQFK